MFITPSKITEIRIRELGDTLDKVTRWKSLGLFNKALHSRDHSETLESYQGTIQNALEELQVGTAMYPTLIRQS